MNPVDALHEGVWLRAVLNAVLVGREPLFARFVSWDGRHYILGNADGTQGAMTIDGSRVVGVFFDPDSPRNPYSQASERHDLSLYFRGMPSFLESIADETLQYNHQSWHGAKVAVATAVFWSDDERLVGAFPWAEVERDGAHLVRIERLGNTPEAWDAWKDACQCSADELSFARAMFEQRMESLPERLVLAPEAIAWLRNHATSATALEASMRALAAAGITPSA